MTMPRPSAVKIQVQTPKKIESKNTVNEPKPEFVDRHSVSVSCFSAVEFEKPVYSYNTLINGVPHLIMNVLLPFPYLKNADYQMAHVWLAIPKADQYLESALRVVYQDNPFNGWIVNGHLAKAYVPAVQDWSSQEDSVRPTQELQAQERIGLSDVIVVEQGGLIPWVGIRSESAYDFNDLEAINGSGVNLPYGFSANKIAGFLHVSASADVTPKDQRNAQGKELVLPAKLFRDARDEAGCAVTLEMRDSNGKSRAQVLADELQASRSMYFDGSLRIDYRARNNPMIVSFALSLRSYRTVGGIAASSAKSKKDLVKKNGANEALSLLATPVPAEPAHDLVDTSTEIERLQAHLAASQIPFDVSIERQVEVIQQCSSAEF